MKYPRAISSTLSPEDLYHPLPSVELPLFSSSVTVVKGVLPPTASSSSLLLNAGQVRGRIRNTLDHHFFNMIKRPDSTPSATSRLFTTSSSSSPSSSPQQSTNRRTRSTSTSEPFPVSSSSSSSSSPRINVTTLSGLPLLAPPTSSAVRASTRTTTTAMTTTIKKKSRQPKIQEHLKAVKSTSSSPSCSPATAKLSSLIPVEGGNGARRTIRASTKTAQEENHLETNVNLDAGVASGSNGAEAMSRPSMEEETRIHAVLSAMLLPAKTRDSVVVATKSSSPKKMVKKTKLDAAARLSPAFVPTDKIHVAPPLSSPTLSPPRQSKRAASSSKQRSSGSKSFASTGAPSHPSSPLAPRISISRASDHTSSPPLLCSTTPSIHQTKENSLALPIIITSAPTAPSTPAERKHERLKAFEPRPAGTIMMAADVLGMGRIIMPRLGRANGVSVGSGGSNHGSTSSSGGTTANTSLDSAIVGIRLGSIQSWLDSPEMSEEESRDSWSTIPKEWEADLDGSASSQLMMIDPQPSSSKSSLARAPVERDEMEMETEIRVGGKSISILTRTKRRRDEQREHSEQGVQVATVMHQSKRFKSASSGGSKSKKGNGKLVNGTTPEVVACVCDRGDDGEAMIRCDDCEGWYHLECLNINKKPKRSESWNCFRCSSVSSSSDPSALSIITPTTRHHKHVTFSTPILSPTTEPTFAPSSLTPRQSGNFNYASSSDPSLVAAPGSPARRVTIAPHTPSVPSSSSALSLPATPQLTRVDYSPRSPLFYRSSRSRVLSGGFDSHAAASGGGAGEMGAGWVGGWDEHSSTVSLLGVETLDAAGGSKVMPVDDDDFLRYLTTTPSRAIGTTFPGLQTPLSSTHRLGGSPMTGGGGGSSSGRKLRGDSHHSFGSTTSSQDFLSTLHQLAPPSPSYTQKLFGTLSHSANAAPSTSAISQYLASPSSPLGPKQSRSLSSATTGKKSQLLSSPVARSAFYSPSVPSSSTDASASLALAESIGSKAVPLENESESQDDAAPAMQRTGSGLGIEFAA